MATGTSPSAAKEALSTTDEKANFQRLARLLMRGGLALLREVFEAIHPPANLPAVLGNPAVKGQLQTLKKKGVLFYHEWKCLYNPLGPKSADFYISLLYKLLRSICKLITPATGWDKEPNSTDNSLEADIVRIRCYRNKHFGHNHCMEITDTDFEKLWMEISEALLRIADSISSAKRDEWKKAFEKFSHDPLTPDAEECVDLLRLSYLMDMNTKDMLEQVHEKLDEKVEQVQENLSEKVEQLQENLSEKVKQVQEQLIQIYIVLESLTAGGSFVSSAPQVQGAQLPSESMETRIPIPPEQPPVEGTAGLPTSTELQASQQNRPIILDFWHFVYSIKTPLDRLIRWLKIQVGVDVQDYSLGSLVITASCSSLEVLEAMWTEYRTGHLNEVAQDTLVTAEVLEKLHLSEVKLRTIISEEDYLSYKDFLKYRPGNGKKTIPQAQGISPATERAVDNISGEEEKIDTPSHEALQETLDLMKKAYDIMKEQFLDVRKEKEAFDSVAKKLEHVTFASTITLNVGGRYFTTSLQTLTKDTGSMLHAMFSGKFDTKPAKDGSYFIDRDGTHFRYILNYLRTGLLLLPEDKQVREELLREAEFYEIRGIVDELRHPPSLPFKGSTILSNEQKEIFVNDWLKETLKSGRSDFVLIYRASRDGWSSSNFHTLCDNKGPTVTVVKSGNYIFGGYTEQSWDRKHFIWATTMVECTGGYAGSGNYKHSTESFLFSLVNSSGAGPTKLPVKKTCSPYAIFCSSECGPTFGGGHDLNIASEANANSNSLGSVGHSYQRPSHGNASSFLAGQQHFRVNELEVFVFQAN